MRPWLMIILIAQRLTVFARTKSFGQKEKNVRVSPCGSVANENFNRGAIDFLSRPGRPA